ncbi:hypothetical protein JMJ35_004341 [Cladonia borealis]|uniref:Kinetochore protein NDC80 n=1 Tax=Cladonia borealis TaxID=184061 RepID=A0AA39R211_9LECA|nr:hypothetical protein JMJ35_004341 [Cladonia borealis]
MSQDTGLFSVRRPRETLGGINFNSGIPQPQSALKRSNSISHIKEPQAPLTSHHGRSASSSGKSLAPNRPQQPNFQRSSSGTNLADLGRPSTVQRSLSSNLFANAASGSRMSYAPGTMTPAHHQPLSGSQSLQRRSSVFSRPSSTGPMGHQSFFTQAPAPASARPDPRPWRDPNYRNKVGQELLDYLTRNNFELEMKRSLNQKSMTSPTQKDFEAIFQWLYHRIDPAYRFLKSIDFEGPAILKQLRYPFENKVSKSQWAAVGGQNWSSFLGMLQWMMQLAQMMDKYDAGEYDDACAEAGVDVSGDRIIFRFLSGAYHDWLQVDDQVEEEEDRMLVPHIEAMAAEFERGNKKYAEEMKILEAENAVLKQQIAEAEAGAPDLAKLEKHFKILEDDKRKFEEYNNNVEGKVEKYEQRNKFLVEEIDRTENELREAEQEKNSLQHSVDSQGITIQDIDRMNSERERLQKGLESTSSKLEEVKKKEAEKEADANRALEELERVVDKYNSLCYQIALIPSDAANAKGQDFELRLNIDSTPNFSSSQLGSSQRGGTNDRLLADPSTGYHPPNVLNLDLRGYVKSQFIRLRKEINERRTLAIDADMKNHELLDSIKEAIDDKRSEVEALEHRVRAAEEEFDKTKEVTSTQKVASDSQIEKMEKELAKMRAGLDESVQLMEQREMNTNIEFEQLTLRANTLREELHTEIEKILNDVIKFKVHIQQSLENYEGFVDQEVKAELDEGGTEDDVMAVDGPGE